MNNIKPEDCETFNRRGSHSLTAAPGTAFDRNGDPIDMICRDCSYTEHEDVALPRMAPPSDDWYARTAGHTFSEDLNSDGTLKTPDN